MKKIFTYLVIIFVTSLTLNCNDDKSDNSKTRLHFTFSY